VLAGAFSFGFFETFSPCLLILLSFVLSYSIGGTTRFKEGFSKVMTFGIGFVFATVFVFLASVGLVVASSTFAFQNVLMWVVFAIAIFFGLDLLGLSVLKFLRLEVKTKSTIQKLSRKLAFTYIGLIILGFLFYFLDPCIAPIFIVMFGTFQQALLEFLPLVLFVFCIGVMLPFIGIGILAGSISKLARGAYRHRSKIRAVSGIILIAYAVYFIIIYIT
jgi:cytochrome c biogenesis protein CcdA